MNKILIFDTTLRDGEQSPGCSMHLSEKLDIAEALEALGVDVIEAGFPAASEGEFKAVQSIAAACKNSAVAGLCRCKKEDIDKTYAAIKGAAHPRIHIFIATSPVHLERKLHIDQNRCLEIIDEYTRYARSLAGDVQFSFEDASRTPIDFLTKATQTAVLAGATTINLPDTTGYATPQETYRMVDSIINNVDGIENVVLSMHCHNDLGMAVANSLAGVAAGARQVECTVNGIGERAGNAALEEIVMALKTRENAFDAYTDVDSKKLYRTSRLVSSVIGVKLPPNKAIVGKNAFVHESGIHQHGIMQDKATYEIINPEAVGMPQNELLLGKHSGKHAFAQLADEMGYSLTEEQINAVFPAYKELADRKKEITRADIEALLAGHTRRIVKRIYALKDYEVSAYKNSASASVVLQTEGKTLSDKMSGDGPIDAGFKAISAITGQSFKLIDYQLHSVSEGKDALGEATVKLADGDVQTTGKGISTDVLEASLLAYVDATNKLLQYEA